MKPARYFSLITGIFFLALGLLGFIPALVSEPTTLPETVQRFGIIGDYGYLFGILPVSAGHSIIHIVVGTLGIAASISIDGARLYSGQVAIAFGLLTVLGLVPVANTLFGIAPIYGAAVWLHGVIAVAAAYFGFFAKPSLLRIYDQQIGSEKPVS